MSGRFVSKTWSVLVPDGWSAQHDSECVTFTADPSLGALQISAYIKDADVEDADLRDFAAEQLEAGVPTHPVQTSGGFVGFDLSFESAYEGEELWCRQWYLRQGRQLVFVTYTCPSDVRRVEDPLVDAAVESLDAPPQKDRRPGMWRWRA